MFTSENFYSIILSENPQSKHIQANEMTLLTVIQLSIPLIIRQMLLRAQL